MSIVAFDHIAIAMPPGEEALARAFYGGVLGFSETPKPPELAKRGGVWFEQGNAKLHLAVEQDFHPSGKAHPALLVEDLDALLERCRQAGCPVDLSQPELDGYRRLHVLDPFGNRIELMELLD
jgi:catechol 2,3-dioxygenase-like lactoylglutathione lyase family enzyme